MLKRVITRAVYDIETEQCLERESYFYDGQWELATPPTKALDEECSYYGGPYQAIVRTIASVAATAVLATSLLARQVANQPQDEIFTVPGTQDEDFWQNPVAPLPLTIYQPLPYLPDAQDIPAGNLFGQPDEDFWWNQVAPVPAANQWPQPWFFDVQEPAGSLFGQPDEDYWINPVAPIPASHYQLLPYLPDAQDTFLSIPGGGEDYWQVIQPPTPTILAATDDSDLPALQVALAPDEDYWANPTAPVQTALYQRLPYLPDPEELAFQAPAVFAPDEDYWQNLVPLVSPGFYHAPLYLFDPEEPVVPAPSVQGEANPSLGFRTVITGDPVRLG